MARKKGVESVAPVYPGGAPLGSAIQEGIVDESDLLDRLETAFGGSRAERDAVARAARDLTTSGHFRTDTESELTAGRVIAELEDAPDGGPAERWNWWMGALDVAYGGYADYQVRRWQEVSDDEEAES
jgi:hypothetical protein